MLLLLLMLACTGAEPADSGAPDSGAVTTPDQVAAELAEPGPHGVGYTEQEVVYTDPAGASRTLRLALWYPSPDSSGETVKYIDFVDAPGVMRDASVAEGSFPVIVFSHGHLGYAEASGFLMAHLASHGWLVASPEHTNDTTFDGGDRTTEIYFQRPADISATLDQLSTTWSGTADMDVIVGIGHSFGGYTLHALAGARHDIQNLAPACYDGSDTTEFCSTMTPAAEAIFAAGFEDDRIDAIMSIGAGDYRLYGDAGITGIDVPGLWMAGELDGANDQAAELFEVVQGGPDGQDLHRRVQIAGAGHNFCIDLTAALDFDTPIEDEEGFRIARVFAAAAARRHGLADVDVDPILDGDFSISDAVTVTR